VPTICGSRVRRSLFDIFLIDEESSTYARINITENITEIESSNEANLLNFGSPTRARTWDLRIDMASVVKRAQEFLPSKHHAGRTSPIGEATGSSMTTVDQTDMRALVSRKTVVRHGAASL
jgi:hypothetical protein